MKKMIMIIVAFPLLIKLMDMLQAMLFRKIILQVQILKKLGYSIVKHFTNYMLSITYWPASYFIVIFFTIFYKRVEL